MLELVLIKNVIPNGDNLQLEDKEKMKKASTGAMIVYLAIFIWALAKAVSCGKKTGNKVTHVLFASISPVLYLLFAYFSKGFCN